MSWNQQRSHDSRWPRIPVYEGFRWSFFRRTPAAPDILVLGESTRRSQRTPKLARVEAVLLVADAPVALRRLVQWATLSDVAEARRLIEQLNQAYEARQSAFYIEQMASGYRLLTRPVFAFWLGKLHQRGADLKLTPPALETLAIVAYRQPITRADIEKIRRVQCAEMLKHLMDRGLVRIGGEHDSLGRPFLYETTRQFLELVGAKTLAELPMFEQLRPSPTLAVTSILNSGDALSDESAA